MTWVRRQADQPQKHRCSPPMAWVADDPMAIHSGEPEGQIGDLWRCGECRRLWRVGRGCDGCDRGGWHQRCCVIPHRKWRWATLTQNFAAFWQGR